MAAPAFYGAEDDDPMMQLVTTANSSSSTDPSFHMRTAPLYTPVDIEMAIGDMLYRWNPFSSQLFLPTDEAILASFARGDQLVPWDGVYLAVMATVPSRTSWWRTQRRRLEHLVCGPWHHPELVFWRERTTRTQSYCLSVSVYEERGVDFSEVVGAASFDSERHRSVWELVHLDLTAAQAMRAYLFLMIQRGKPFNNWGYHCYYCPPMSWFVGAALQNEASWTCAQLVCQALIEADPARYGNGVLDPKATTPTELYYAVKRVGESVIVNHLGR